MGSNHRQLVLETSALPTELQTCLFISIEFFCYISKFWIHVLFATEFFYLDFYNPSSNKGKNLIPHPNTMDTIRWGKLSGNLYHILRFWALLCFCVLTYSVEFTQQKSFGFFITFFFYWGRYRIWTYVSGFADRCLTTRPTDLLVSPMGLEPMTPKLKV